MSKPTPTLGQKLSKFNISRQRYDDEAPRLLAAGFTQKQTDSLIMRRSSRNTVRAVLNHCTALLAAPYHLNRVLTASSCDFVPA